MNSFPTIWRIGLIVALIVGAIVVVARPSRVRAAPPALNCNAGNAAIFSPQAGAVLSGVIQVEGTASLGGGFQYYKLEFSQANKDDWVVIGGLVRQEVVNGQLAVWDSASVPDDQYALRLRVVDQTGNYCESIVHNLRVQNANPLPPTETPTLEESPTPTETEGTPSFSVVPTIAPTLQLPGATETPGAAARTATPPPGVTRTPASTSLLPGGINTNSLFDALGEIFGGLFRTFLFGVMAMAGVFIVVGVIYYVRRVL